MQISYSEAIFDAHDYLLKNYPDVFVIGQGLWSPWYVGNTMKGLDIKYGKERIIDTPVSENICTGVGVGAGLTEMRPIVVHPRMDFMLYAIDPIVNQAAKWSYIFGGQAHSKVTIRTIINRGGEQGAQHSQSLYSWFAHIPGLRVLMPSNARDARDFLIAATLSDDPVIYIDDRWLYDFVEEVPKDIEEIKINSIEPKIICNGNDITVVSLGFSTQLVMQTIQNLKKITLKML